MASLAARLPGGCPPATVESLLQNCGTTIAFSTHDPHTLAHLQAQAGPAAREAVLEACGVRLRQGQAVVVSHHLERHGGPVCATVRAGATAGYPHMASGLHQPLPEVAADRFAPPATVMLDNPIGPSHGDIEPWANWLIGGADYRVDELRDLLRGRRGRRLMSASLDFPDNAREREVRLERRGDTLYLEAKREGGSGAWSLTMPFREAVDLVEMPGLAERDCGARGVATTEAPWSVERHDDQPGRRAGVRISYARSLSVDVEQHDWDWFVFIVRGFCDLLLRVEREGPRGRMIRDREDHPG
ncbi:hypothetical protein DEM34_16380 [Spiribacter halobius]|uniref:Uncharacterized protein n=1 Tax=Sediminicurvatus halobius TaxID=2182432 RepID=A0A2U2MX79_9GAMM|nr:hypothetical protein DEM34_16380 [Spiribacter halobius]